jgi:hypothetical protein
MVSSRICIIVLFVLLLSNILPLSIAQQSGGNTGSTGNETSPKQPTPPPAPPPIVTPPPDALVPPRDLNPQVFISGQVILEDGAPPPMGAVVEMDCGSTKTREAMVSPNGHFSFQVGDNTQIGQMMPDASEGYDERFRRDSYNSNSSATGAFANLRDIARRSAMFSHANLAGCDLRAQLQGYLSSSARMEGISFTRIVDVGVIVVYPVERVKGTTVSASSLLAPKTAKRAMEQGKKEFKKGKFEESEALLKAAIEQYRNYGEAWLQLGQLYQKQLRKDDARHALQKAIEADAYFIPPYLALGWLESQEKRWREVADNTDRVLALDPMSFPEAYYLNALANTSSCGSPDSHPTSGCSCAAS